HTGESARIVALGFTILTLDGDAVFFRIHVFYARIFAWLDAQHFTAARVTHHVAFLVLSRPLPICSRHLLSRVEHAEFVFVLAYRATLLHFPMDSPIQFATGCVVRPDD